MPVSALLGEIRANIADTRSPDRQATSLAAFSKLSPEDQVKELFGGQPSRHGDFFARTPYSEEPCPDWATKLTGGDQARARAAYTEAQQALGSRKEKPPQVNAIVHGGVTYGYTLHISAQEKSCVWGRTTAYDNTFRKIGYHSWTD